MNKLIFSVKAIRKASTYLTEEPNKTCIVFVFMLVEN